MFDCSQSASNVGVICSQYSTLIHEEATWRHPKALFE